MDKYLEKDINNAWDYLEDIKSTVGNLTEYIQHLEKENEELKEEIEERKKEIQ